MANKERESNERIARENEAARASFENALAMLSKGMAPLSVAVVPTQTRFDKISAEDQSLVKSVMDVSGCTTLYESDSHVSLKEQGEYIFAPCQLVYVDTEGTRAMILDE